MDSHSKHKKFSKTTREKRGSHPSGTSAAVAYIPETPFDALEKLGYPGGRRFFVLPPPKPTLDSKNNLCLGTKRIAPPRGKVFFPLDLDKVEDWEANINEYGLVTLLRNGTVLMKDPSVPDFDRNAIMQMLPDEARQVVQLCREIRNRADTKGKRTLCFLSSPTIEEWCLSQLLFQAISKDFRMNALIKAAPNEKKLSDYMLTLSSEGDRRFRLSDATSEQALEACTQETKDKIVKSNGFIQQLKRPMSALTKNGDTGSKLSGGQHKVEIHSSASLTS